MAFNRSAFSASSMKQTAIDVVENKTNYAGSNKTHKWYKLINGIKPYVKPKEPGKVVVNILPFLDASGNPQWSHNVFVHQIPVVEGFGSNDYLCTHNDPLCKRKDELDNGENWDEIKAFVAKGRTAILVNPVGTDDVLLLECGTKNRGKALPEMIRSQAVAMADGEPCIDFWSIDEGKSVVLVYGEQSFNGHKYMDVSAVSFVSRKEEISDEVLSKIPDVITQINNVGPNDNDEMETLMNGGTVSVKRTEEEKQEAFEQFVMKEEPKPATMDAFKVKDDALPEGPLTEDDFKVNPMTIKKSEPKSDELVCPNGFDIASEFGCHRQCMRCPFADKCEKVAG